MNNFHDGDVRKWDCTWQTLMKKLLSFLLKKKKERKER
jgi:hypothetical protein